MRVPHEVKIAGIETDSSGAFKVVRSAAIGKFPTLALVPPARNSWNRLVQEISAFAGLLRSTKNATEAAPGAVRRNANDRTPVDEIEPKEAA